MGVWLLCGGDATLTKGVRHMGISKSSSSYGRWFVYGLPNGSSRYFWRKSEAVYFVAVVSVAGMLASFGVAS